MTPEERKALIARARAFTDGKPPPAASAAPPGPSAGPAARRPPPVEAPRLPSYPGPNAPQLPAVQAGSGGGPGPSGEVGVGPKFGADAVSTEANPSLTLPVESAELRRQRMGEGLAANTSVNQQIRDLLFPKRTPEEQQQLEEQIQQTGMR